MQSNNCPKCGSEDILVESSGMKPDFEFNGREITALKFESPTNLSSIEIECQGCHAKLKPTIEGYREI